MEFLGSVFEIVKNLRETTGKWFGYINSLDTNMKNLKRKIEELGSQEDDINTELSSAQQQSRKRQRKVVEDWLRDVHTLKGDVQIVQRRQQEVVGWKYFFSRAQLGKLVMEKIEEVAELQEKGRFSNGLLIDSLPTSGWFIPTTATSFGETTSARNMEKVWKCLMDDEVRQIGVFGMGGVGKTIIMHHINNQLLNETCEFDDVIWVTVSQAFNIRNLQREIAIALNLEFFKYDDEMRRASKLYAMLSRKKRYVLILDDLWEAFPLEKVGIPEPTRDNGCKLVLTTRSLEVCRKMECIAVKVELLTEEEALNLFMSIVEEHQTVLTPEVQEIATKVAKECSCLPLAIVTTAGSMKGVNDIHQWRNALNVLISSTKEIWDDESVVFQRLKFSYSRLKDEKLQHCFLYCALYPKTHTIPREELIEYWIAEELITGMNSVEAMFDQGHTMLNKLINACLLESLTNKYGEECVRMHDLIKDMVLKITTTSPRFMVQAGEESERVPYEDWSKDLERVSLMFNRIKELPSGPPNCPRLTTLILRHTALLRIPDSFFMYMRELKILDLSGTRIQYLPKSIFKLENLHALLLENCKELMHVSSLEKLKTLKELKLNKSQIVEVPQGIEELVNLKNLDLSRNYRLHMFASWKLCRHTQLQSLRLHGTTKVSAKELLCLTQLKSLSVQFQNVQELTSCMTSRQCQSLENYRLMVGNEVWVKINNTKSFEIKRCHELISLSDILSLRDDGDLRKCVIKYCYGIKSIFSSSSFSKDNHIPLRTVDSLEFVGLPKFRVLFDGVVPPYNISFNLKKLLFYRCSRIKNIFPANLLQNFPSLEELIVSECKNLKDIIVEVNMSDLGHRQDDSITITLQNFKSLRLNNLPRLKSIYKGLMVCESLQDILVYKCSMLRRLPLSLHMNGAQASAPPALKRIQAEENWWESLEWNDRHTKATLQPLFLTMGGCVKNFENCLAYGFGFIHCNKREIQMNSVVEVIVGIECYEKKSF
ncbi:unnamed protein product [Camellia sinensis]